MKQLVLEGRHQESSEDDDDDDNNDPDMGDMLNLECTKNIMASKIMNSIHHGFQMISQDLPSRRKEKITDDTAITESDNYNVGADDVLVPKDNKMFEYIERTDEEEDTGSDDEWHPESFSIDVEEEEEDSDHKGGPVAFQKFTSSFLSYDGGSKQWKQVDQHASQITKIIKAVGGFEFLTTISSRKSGFSHLNRDNLPKRSQLQAQSNVTWFL